MCSWDEMAKYDLPAMLNYVLNVTGHQKLFYVGHSQGTLIAFARLSQDHDLANKVCFDCLLMVVTSNQFPAEMFFYVTVILHRTNQ